MCLGDDQTCPQFQLHRQKLLEDLDHERRGFLKSTFVAGGGAATWAASGLATPASAQTKPGQPTYHYLPANSDTVHWGWRIGKGATLYYPVAVQGGLFSVGDSH